MCICNSKFPRELKCADLLLVLDSFLVVLLHGPNSDQIFFLSMLFIFITDQLEVWHSAVDSLLLDMSMAAQRRHLLVTSVMSKVGSHFDTLSTFWCWQEKVLFFPQKMCHQENNSEFFFSRSCIYTMCFIYVIVFVVISNSYYVVAAFCHAEATDAHIKIQFN